MTKDEVRDIAQKEGLPVADKPDSQELCFVSDDYAAYIEANRKEQIPKEGNFVDVSGRVLGRHKGLIHYTVGQRKGLGISAECPLYVKNIDPVKNEILLGNLESIMYEEVICSDLNFLSIERPKKGFEFDCRVKIRYHHAAQDAKVIVTDDDILKIRFKEPVKAPAPGQAAVFYDEDGCVIGGGTIQRS